MDWFMYDRDLRHERVNAEEVVAQGSVCELLFFLIKAMSYLMVWLQI